MMKKILLCSLVFFLSIISCGEDYSGQLQELRDELNLQKQLIEAISKRLGITNIVSNDLGYTIFFSDGTSVAIENGETPLILIGENNNWFINGTDTGVKAIGQDGITPTIEIGNNGNWFINGIDTEIKAKGENGTDAPRITSIIQTEEEFIFNFSDGTTIFVTKTYEIDSFNVVLPKNLFFTEGIEYKIFYDNFIFKSQNYPTVNRFYFSNLSGINFQDYYQGIPTERGIWNGKIRVFDNLALKNISNHQYKVVRLNEGINSKNVLFIGDSFTDIGTYISYISSDFVSKGLRLNLLGTMGNSDSRHEAHSGGNLENTILTTSLGVAKIVSVENLTVFPQSGYPGTTYLDDNGNKWIFKGKSLDENGNGKIKIRPVNTKDTKVTIPLNGKLYKTESFNGVIYPGQEEISYTDVDNVYFNSFWNPEKEELDFKYYFDYWNYENPDVIILKFGWNDLGAWASDSKINKTSLNVKQVIDKIHEDFPNTKVIYSIQPNGQINNIRNIDTDGMLYSLLKFSQDLKEIFEQDNYENFVYLAPTYAYVDPYNSYTDGVHPNHQGFREIANCLYPILVDIFNN